MKKSVVSLIASSTEMICAMGFEPQLVGRSHECDFPLSVKKLPICSEPNFDIQGSSLEVDIRVKELLKAGKALYKVDGEKLKELLPDVIVTQDHCEVCAVSLDEVERIVCGILPSQPKIVALKPGRISDIWEGAQKIADALGESRKGEAFTRECQRQMDGIAAKARTATSQPTVACLEWLEPLMAGGNWVPELVELLGAKNLFGEAGKYSHCMTFDELARNNPDVIVIMPCGWDIPKAREEMKSLVFHPRWADLKAVREKRVYLTDGNPYFNRPGPRVVESLQILAELFYPELFRPMLQGLGWQKWEG